MTKLSKKEIARNWKIERERNNARYLDSRELERSNRGNKGGKKRQ